MPGLCWGSARDPSGAVHIQLGFTPASADERLPSGWRSWRGRGHVTRMACLDWPFVTQFPWSPIGRLKKQAGNVVAIAPLLSGMYRVSCWKARMSQGDSQTCLRPFLSLNTCTRQFDSEQQGPCKAAHTNVLYFEKVYSFNRDSFNWALPSLGAIKWHLLAPDLKATVYATPSYPALAALLCITASHLDLTNLIHV